MSELTTYQKNRISTKNFKLLKNIVYEYSGIKLNDSKIELLKNRLRKRVLALKLESYSEYCSLIASEYGEKEIPHMIDAVSTNTTAFFREKAHYRFLYEYALPSILQNSGSNDNVKIWSAACSSGEEPYSLAMVTDYFLQQTGVTAKILATDICDQALSKARAGVYSKEQIKAIPKYLAGLYLKSEQDQFILDQAIYDMIFFKKFNLINPAYPFDEAFDIIFCRNVMIYFDKPTQQKIVANLKDSLKTGGFLFVGHAESLSGKIDGFHYEAPAIFRKVS